MTTATYLVPGIDTPDVEDWPVHDWPTPDVPSYPDDIPEPGFTPDDEPYRKQGC